MMCRRHLMAGGAAVLAMASTMSAPMTAQADPEFDYNDWTPDRGYHSICFNAEPDKELPYYPKGMAERASRYLDNATQVTILFTTPCDTSGDGQTDVVWRRNDDTTHPNLIGQIRCRRKWSNGLCDRYWSAIFVQNIKNHYSDSNHRQMQYRKTACHELGHTVDLVHYSGDPPDPMANHDCMRSGWVGSGGEWIKRYSNHHKEEHINDWFDEQDESPVADSGEGSR